jgi:aconitate hydratase
MTNSFGSRSAFRVGDREYAIFRLDAVAGADRLPFCLKVLLEDLLRREDGRSARAADVEALVGRTPGRELAFGPARVLLQDFTGVPALVDLAAMRDAMHGLGGDPARINPLLPAELVIDHSVQVDHFGTPDAIRVNAEREFARNRQRYAFLRWGQQAFRNFRVVPPATGIVHQVNLEYLARVVFVEESAGPHPLAYPDTLVGTDSHTTMVNGLGVLGWGVGGIEAEAALLGEPVSIALPEVVGFRLTGALPAGATATDLVLTVTQMLRKKGVVDKFVEFYGEGLAGLALADRATIANMAPEYGATCGFFPVDDETLRYLRSTGRPEETVRLVEAYTKEQGLFHTPDMPAAHYSDTVELDLGTVEASLAGPTRPQDRVPLKEAKRSFAAALERLLGEGHHRPHEHEVHRLETEWDHAAAVAGAAAASAAEHPRGGAGELRHGSVVIAAITSCTNTSNPSVMIGAGLLARKAVERGLAAKPWVKTSLAPGSRVVTDYLREAGLLPALERLGFHLVGYGCTTCIGNSGPLPDAVSRAIEEGGLVVAAVLSGNRNFEARIHPQVRANYLASPPLVVAYALAGRMDVDLYSEPLGTDAGGRPVYLRDLWPGPQEVRETAGRVVRPEMFGREYADIFAGDERWRSLEVPEGDLYAWDPASLYVRQPPFFRGIGPEPPPVDDVRGARVLAVLGDSVSTDHISPAGSIPPDSPAGRYLQEQGVKPGDFNSYGSWRGNHEVMVRGTFANVRLRNRLAPDTEGGFTRHLPGGEVLAIYDAAVKYQGERVPLVVLAGKEYGCGSSRDWAAKGPLLLGVRAVLAEGYERIHRSNLVGMGVLPLQFRPGESAASRGLTGEEVLDVEGLAGALAEEHDGPREVVVRAHRRGGGGREFRVGVRVDTPHEVRYYRHGGILNYVLRQLLKPE